MAAPSLLAACPPKQPHQRVEPRLDRGFVGDELQNAV